MARNVSAQQVYDYVRDQIIKKQLFPGNQVVEEDLAFAMQTSRATVRSALTRLHYEGLVDLIPNRGAFIAKPSFADMNSVYALRRLLETEALRCAMTGGDLSFVEQLERSIEAQKALVDHYSMEEYIRLNFEFHWLIIQAANNEYLEKFLRELFNKSAIFLTFYDRSTTNLESVATHEAIVRAIKANDLAGAVKALEDDITCAVDSIRLL